MVGMGIPTDLSYKEAVGWGGEKPITLDMVISVYRDLHGIEKS